jgi:hypothetical protein
MITEHRAYRVLGLAPGSSKDDVRQAYRDLAQVWHPDRFSHNERLEAKAQKNLKRINEAFEVLKNYEPPPGGPRVSRLSTAMNTLRDMGDLMQSTLSAQPQPLARPRARREVLGLGEIERTGVYERRQRPGSRVPWLAVALIGLIVVAAAVIVTAVVVLQ